MISLPGLIANIVAALTGVLIYLLYVNPQFRDGDALNRFARHPPQNRDEWSTLHDAFYRGLYGHSRTLFSFNLHGWYFAVKMWVAIHLVFLYAITACLYFPVLHWTVAALLGSSGTVGLASYWYRYRAVTNYPGPVHDPHAPSTRRNIPPSAH